MLKKHITTGLLITAALVAASTAYSDIVTPVEQVEARRAALREDLKSMGIEIQEPNPDNGYVRSIIITGRDIYVQGGGSPYETDGAVLLEGTNLFVRSRTPNNDQTGNVIIGHNNSVHTNGRFADNSLVAGKGNRVGGSHQVVFGTSNTAGYEATGACVVGGISNTASGVYSTVSGGERNVASNRNASVSGGFNNQATGLTSTISGGNSNVASGTDSSVSGGYSGTSPNFLEWSVGRR